MFDVVKMLSCHFFCFTKLLQKLGLTRVLVYLFRLPLESKETSYAYSPTLFSVTRRLAGELGRDVLQSEEDRT